MSGQLDVRLPADITTLFRAASPSPLGGRVATSVWRVAASVTVWGCLGGGFFAFVYSILNAHPPHVVYSSRSPWTPPNGHAIRSRISNSACPRICPPAQGVGNPPSTDTHCTQRHTDVCIAILDLVLLLKAMPRTFTLPARLLVVHFASLYASLLTCHMTMIMEHRPSLMDRYVPLQTEAQ